MKARKKKLTESQEAYREYWNEYQRDYYHANREKIRARQAEYYRSKRA